ncbi:MAG: hypothetical protein MRY21_06790 [Simkaniaceae bacterium]|nr:hypothetical protein [Simkaniaceae bacterium]
MTKVEVRLPKTETTRAPKSEKKPKRPFSDYMKEEIPAAPGPFTLFTQDVQSSSGVEKGVQCINEVILACCEKMRFCKVNGIGTIEVDFHSQVEGSPLQDLSFKIDCYDSAPTSWHIEFNGAPQAIDFIRENVKTLEAALTRHFAGDIVETTLNYRKPRKGRVVATTDKRKR